MKADLPEISRKSLDNKEFVRQRQATERIASALGKRLAAHLEVTAPLFVPRNLLGSYVKSASMEDVPGSDKAFADLQERYAAVCEKPFSLPRKLPTPMPPVSTHLDAAPFQYALPIPGAEGRPVSVTSPVRWILSYRGECPLSRLRAMVSGTESRVPEEMRQALVNLIVPGVYLKQFPPLRQLLEDLRYRVETVELPDLGGLPVVVLGAPLPTFLPPDDFILQVTQLSGVAAFQEIVDRDGIEKLRDPLRGLLHGLLG